MPRNTLGDKMLADINKTFKSATGKAVAVYADEMAPVGSMNSGSLALDFAIGIGGVPTNRVIEICGSEGGGKTTLGLLMARNFIDAWPDRYVVVLDTEHKLTPEWVEKLMGKERLKNLLVVDPDHVEQATQMMRQMITTGGVSMLMLDSVGGSPTSQVMDDERSAEQADSMGGNAKAMAKFSRFAVNLAAKYDTLVVGINQARDDLKSRHGNMLNTPGGRAWKHACVLRIHLRRGKEKYHVKRNGEEVQVGYDIVAQVIKNQLGGTEGRTAQWRFFNYESEMFGPVGVDTTEECVRLAQLTGVLRRAEGSSWYHHASFPADKKGECKLNGLDAVNKMVKADEAVRMSLISETMAALTDDPDKLGLISPLDEMPVDADDDSDPAPAPISGKSAVGMASVPNDAD